MNLEITENPTKQLNPTKFPHPPSPPSTSLPGTLQNVAHMLREYGISSRFDVIRKKLIITYNGGSPASLGEVVSLTNLNRMTTNWLEHFLFEIGTANPRNPVKDWILSKPWDGEERVQAICDTITPVEDYPAALKRVLIHKWLLSATAAAIFEGTFKARGVLTLQGPQGIGKTSWVAKLISDPALRKDCVLLDHHLDSSNRDSILAGITAWIVEIGELDSSFKKDVARLKGFLTRESDKLRPAYAKATIHYPRRTVFAATVNDEQFLVDHTGNSRWWTIACEHLNFQHSIDMQQLFAELAVEIADGAHWWLDREEEALLAEYNLRHRSASAIGERLRDHIDCDRSRGGEGNYTTATELLRDLDIKNPSNAQARECGSILRDLLGPPKRVKGREKWRIASRHFDQDFTEF
jgi:putative DNA primase/helicase